MGGLGWLLVQWRLGTWLMLSSVVAALFILIVFIRITVPRFRLETLSRLGWAVLLALLGGVWVAYAAGLLLA